MTERTRPIRGPTLNASFSVGVRLLTSSGLGAADALRVMGILAIRTGDGKIAVGKITASAAISAWKGCDCQEQELFLGRDS
jgi:hypothetical protein